MRPPFTPQQFLGVFQSYNLSIWPMQLIAYLLGITVLLLAVRRTKHSSGVIWSVLAFYWLWMGGVYHLLYFRAINPAAPVFGFLFILQGFLFMSMPRISPDLSFRCRWNAACITGGLLIVYAMLVYPVIGTLLGHGYPRSPVFGVAPCPTTIYTYGLLLWADKRVPRWLLVIPFLWSLVGFVAAVSLGIREDLGLLVAGLISVGISLFPHRADKSRKTGTAPGDTSWRRAV